MKYVAPGICAYCKETQRHANLACPYNLTAHAQYVRATRAPGTLADEPSGANDSILVPILADVVAAEVAADTWDSAPAPASDPAPDTSGTFEGFGGGDSGGGGASDTF